MLVVLIADDRSTLCGTITYGISEADAMQETLHFLVESSTTDDNLIEVSSKCLSHLIAYLLAYLLVDDRHVEKHAHAVVLYLRENFLADNLLDNQRHSDDNGWLDAAECLGDNSRTWDAGEEEYVATGDKLKQELKCHTIHVSHRKDADDRVARLDLLRQYVLGEVDVAPERTVRYHHTLGETGGSAGIIDERHLLWILIYIIMYVFLTEILREFDTEHLVEVLTGIGQLVCAGYHQ